MNLVFLKKTPWDSQLPKWKSQKIKNLEMLDFILYSSILVGMCLNFGTTCSFSQLVLVVVFQLWLEPKAKAVTCHHRILKLFKITFKLSMVVYSMRYNQNINTKHRLYSPFFVVITLWLKNHHLLFYNALKTILLPFHIHY